MSSKKTHARKKKIDYFKGAKNSEYENLLKLVLKEGKEKSDRTGTGILSAFVELHHFIKTGSMRRQNDEPPTN